MKGAYRKGRAGEELALQYFIGLGYYLLQRNFRIRPTGVSQPLSEIDLILLGLCAHAPPASQQDFQRATADKELARLLSEQQQYLVLVFVEVKNWGAYPAADLCYNLNPKRRQRMFQTAECFLQRHLEYASLQRRFDLVLLQPGNPTGKGGAPIEQIRHIEAALP